VKLWAHAPAKVNLSLFVGATREDQRHRLATLFQSVSLADLVEAETLDRRAPDEVICPGVQGENLAARALAGLRARGWDGPPLRLTIDKRIPVAAGMGGGSADAAAALRLAMAVAPGRAEEVDAVAAELGADVPSQLLPGVSVGTGAGEIVERFEPIAQHAFVIVPSHERLSTAAVYAEADRLGLKRSDAQLGSAYLWLLEAVESGEPLPDELMINDLEEPAVSLCPSIFETLAAVRRAGADHAMVSGSGPTVFGLWWGPEAAAAAVLAAEHLADAYPGVVSALPVSAEFGSPSLI
jgi:4-diphosphocytidyl-2-C-methyl-D-erythritol kinase